MQGEERCVVDVKVFAVVDEPKCMLVAVIPAGTIVETLF